MAQVPFIDDNYINEIIKAAEAYNPALNKTQGVKLRELIKRLRDRMEQNDADAVRTSGNQVITGTKSFTQISTEDVSFVKNGFTSVLKNPLNQNQHYVNTLPRENGELALTSNLNKSGVGLGNVDNTSDADKPVSVAQQLALNSKVNVAEKGAINGVATLDNTGKVPLTQISDALIGSVNYQGNYDASANVPVIPSAAGNKGKYYVVSVAGTQQGQDFKSGDWIISNGADWQKVDNNNKVSSVNGKLGAVTLSVADISGAARNDGNNASGTWGINITGTAGNAGNAGTWNSQTYSHAAAYDPELFLTYKSNDAAWRGASISTVQSRIGLNNGSTLNNSISGYAPNWGSSSSSAKYNGSPVDAINTYIMGYVGNGEWRPAPVQAARTWLGLSSDGLYHQESPVFGTDADAISRNTSSFTYALNAPYNGSLMYFGAGDYGTQLNTQYGNGKRIAFRTKNGDVGRWNPWYELFHTGNLNPQIDAIADSVVKRDGNGFIFNSYIHTTDNIENSGLSYLMGKNATDHYHRSYTAAAVKEFLGMPVAGETWDSVTARGNYTNSSVKINGGFTLYYNNADNTAGARADLRGTTLHQYIHQHSDNSPKAWSESWWDGANYHNMNAQADGIHMNTGLIVTGKSTLYGRVEARGGAGTSSSDADLQVTRSGDNAPNLAFHWQGKVASSITVGIDGAIEIRNNPGTGYEGLRCGAFFAQTTIDAGVSVSGGRLFTGYDSGISGSVSASNWFRSDGPTGWFNNTYGGGIHMTDSTYIRTFGSKMFYVDNYIQTNTGFYGSNCGVGLVGTYDPTKYQEVFSMNTDYRPTIDGTSLNNHYGIAWSHDYAGGQVKAGLGHQALFTTAGITQTAIGTGIWTLGNLSVGGSINVGNSITAATIKAISTIETNALKILARPMDLYSGGAILLRDDASVIRSMGIANTANEGDTLVFNGSNLIWDQDTFVKRNSLRNLVFSVLEVTSSMTLPVVGCEITVIVNDNLDVALPDASVCAGAKYNIRNKKTPGMVNIYSIVSNQLELDKYGSFGGGFTHVGNSMIKYQSNGSVWLRVN